MEKNYTLLLNFSKKFNKTLFYKKTIILTLFLVLTPFFIAWGQTTLISPTVNNGGFETGITGWSTAQTGVGKGAWYSGTATAYAGTQSAYISRDLGVTNNYLGDAVRIQHLYRSIAFPAGETTINLSFYWKAEGEGSASDWDNLKVFVSNTLPVAGTANAAADQVGLTWYNLQTTWQNATITLPAALAGTTRYLIFQWKQDGSGTFDPPAAVDNITLTSAAPSVTPVLAITGTTAHGSVCPGTAATSQTYTITNTGTSAASGITVTSSNPTEFVVSSLSSTTVAGSGGTVTYVVTFTPSSTGPKTATITVTSTTAGSNSPTSSLTGTGSTSVSPVAVTNTANNITTTAARLRATAATTFGVCPNTTAKGFVYSVNSVNATPTIGGTGVTNVPVTPLGTTLTTYIFDITGLAPSTVYSYRAYLFDGTSYTYGAVVNFTTLTPTYCSPTSWDPDGLYINSVAFVGALTDPPVNTSTFNATGFQNFTTLPVKAIQAQGEGINIVARSNGTVHVRGTWKAWVDWNKNGTFQPATEEVYNIQGFAGADATFGFVIPPTTPPGDYRIRIRVNNGTDWLGGETFGFDFSPCDNFTSGGWFGDDNYGETEDYLFTVVAACNANIVTAPNGERCDTGTVNLTVTGTASTTGYNWYTAETGGFPINPSPTGATWTTPSLSTTTTYWVTAVNGTCESLKRTKIVAEINATPVVTFTPSTPVVCGDNDIIQLTAGGDVETVTLVNENFEGGGLGVFTGVNSTPNGAPYDAITIWQNETSPYIPLDTEVWSPAISSGLAGNRFVMSTSDVNPPPAGTVRQFLELTSAVNATNMTGLTLTFDMFYSVFGDEVRVQVNDGSGWTTVQTYTASVGIGTRFAPQTINLTAYNNTPSLRFRIQFWSVWGDGIAVDNIKLFGEKPLNTAFNYDTVTVDAFTNISCAPGTEYTPGTPATTIYIKPTLTQLENATFTIPVSATLSSGCAATGSVVVTNNTKIFKAGTAGTDWNLGSNWSPAGVPTANNCVVIFDNDVNITGTNYTGYGLNLTVKPSGNLNVAPTNTALITDFVNVEAGGIFEVEDDASLVQVNNVANTVAGTFNSKRIAVTNSTLDYVYWSTPVAGFSVNNVTPSSTYRYAWNPTVNNGGTYLGNFGNWVGASGAMTTGRGYIIRGSSGNTTFTGVPNNGNITIPITRGTYTSLTNYTGPTATPVTRDDDNWNLLGNPYPSALSADAFLTANFTNLETFVKIWKHGIDPAAIADPFYQDYQLNYDTNDYLTFNRFGGTQDGFDGYIGSGQGFFVLMKDTGATTENAIFNNTMRSNLHRNDHFYRTTDPLDRHRIWIKIISPTNTTNDMLVGYAAEATNAIDDFYDTKNVGIKTNFELYSLIENKGHLIQARALPFDTNDQIPLGVVVPQNGIYRIAIDAVDGLFTNTTQNIYLEDTTLGITHDLRAAPYSFTANVGRYENRFVLKFNNETLGNEDFIANNVTVYTNESINISASNQVIKSVRVHDLLGRVLGTFNNVNSNTFSSKNIAKTQSPLLVEVTLENGATKTYKVIF